MRYDLQWLKKVMRNPTDRTAVEYVEKELRKTLDNLERWNTHGSHTDEINRIKEILGI